MISSPPPSTCREDLPRARPGRLTLAAAVLAAVVCAAPRRAEAQACCVAAGLTTPARLRIYEDAAAGVQTRVRSVLGSFGPQGTYASSPSDNRELDAEEDLFVAKRFGLHWQASLLVPFVQTARSIGGMSGWGGGIGDVSANARFDLLLPGDRPGWPGIAFLTGLTAPTGRAPGDASDLLETSATGTGAWQGNLGVSVEPVLGRAFLSFTGWVGMRTSTDGPVKESFPPSFTELMAAGYSFSGNRTVGAFVQGMQQGNARDDQGPIASTGIRLFTAGVASVWPLNDDWRLQGTAAGDLPVNELGRNHTTGVALTASLARLWM